MKNEFSSQLLRLARRAMDCDVCFKGLGLGLEHALINLPQPKWIGPHYSTSGQKILIVLINPGAGAGWADDANHALLNRLIEFKAGAAIEPVMQHQLNDMPNWGRGRFWKYFFDQPLVGGLGLDPQKIALTNIAWCPTAGNLYPSKMLATCFERHTRELLNLLAPDVVLLCGSNTHPFASLMPRNSEVFSLLHYAHREGNAAQLAQLNDPRLRKALGIDT